MRQKGHARSSAAPALPPGSRHERAPHIARLGKSRASSGALLCTSPGGGQRRHGQAAKRGSSGLPAEVRRRAEHPWVGELDHGEELRAGQAQQVSARHVGCGLAHANGRVLFNQILLHQLVHTPCGQTGKLRDPPWWPCNKLAPAPLLQHLCQPACISDTGTTHLIQVVLHRRPAQQHTASAGHGGQSAVGQRVPILQPVQRQARPGDAGCTGSAHCCG